jgi:hypothetical protein
MKLKRSIIAVTIFSVLMSSFYFALSSNDNTDIVFAQATTQPAPLEEIECPPNFITKLNNNSVTFYALLDYTLRTPNLNSESLNYLFRAYKRAQNQLRNIRADIEKLVPDTESEDSAQNSEIASACFPLFDSEQVQLRYAFLQTYTEVTTKKKDILLFEKFDAINIKFEAMHEDVRATSENIKKFSDLLPCFVTSCLSQ